MKFNEIEFDGNLEKFARKATALGFRVAIDAIKSYAKNGGVDKTVKGLMSDEDLDEENKKILEEFTTVSKEVLLLVCDGINAQSDKILKKLEIVQPRMM